MFWPWRVPLGYADHVNVWFLDDPNQIAALGAPTARIDIDPFSVAFRLAGLSDGSAMLSGWATLTDANGQHGAFYRVFPDGTVTRRTWPVRDIAGLSVSVLPFDDGLLGWWIEPVDADPRSLRFALLDANGTPRDPPTTISLPCYHLDVSVAATDRTVHLVYDYARPDGSQRAVYRERLICDR